MQQQNPSSKVRPGGLVTVAYLKAQLDHNNDHLGIFMPLILDAIGQIHAQSFTTIDIQETLAARHQLAMPQHAIVTLLKRAISGKYISRDAGRYHRNQNKALPATDLSTEKTRIETSQQRLAQALKAHCARRGLAVESNEAALDMLVSFLQEEQIALLLNDQVQEANPKSPGHKEHSVVAEFLEDAIRDDPAFLSTIAAMLEGLVLYNAAFLPELGTVKRPFSNLSVVFDSNLVRQALGYEGGPMRALMRETIDILKGNGAECIVFETTMNEIHRILSMYESKLGTEQGRRSLRPVPMARHFLAQRFSPGDVREMSALLDTEIRNSGFSVRKTPERERQFTASEQKLAQRLSDPARDGDELQARVRHDVDCVAGVLTLRRGHRSTVLDNVQAVFATSSPMVIQNIRLWWQLDEEETCIEPAISVRALANLAWLKRPSLCADFKVRELVSLCTAALRPAPETWTRFLQHLSNMERDKKLSSDEVTAVIVSAMSDRLLRDAEVEQDDPSDIDAVTLDEVVERVKASYTAEADKKLQETEAEYQQKIHEIALREKEASVRAENAEHTAAEIRRRFELKMDGRARTFSRFIARTIRVLVVCVVAAGAIAILAEHSFHWDWKGVLIGCALVTFVALEFLGVLSHLNHFFERIEIRLTRYFRKSLYRQNGLDEDKVTE
jgi:hypothetical protein